MKPEEFVTILIPKLEVLKRQQESGENLDKTLGITHGSQKSDLAAHSTLLMEALLHAKLTQNDDNDQSILDQHVSRVWSDSTPHRSPGTRSPYHSITKRSTDVLRNDYGIERDKVIGKYWICCLLRIKYLMKWFLFNH